MMDLADASAFFDRTNILDAFSGAVLFQAQIDPYDESKRDAGSAYRRILSVRPGTVMPVHRTVSIHGQTWLVGSEEVDGHEGPHRTKYTLQAAKPAQVRTLAQLLAGLTTQVVYSGVEWLKDSKEVEASSEVSAQFVAYLSEQFVIQRGQVVTCAGHHYLVTGARLTASGYLAAVAAELDYPVVTATITTPAFDPVAGSSSAGASSTVAAMRVRWQSLFEYGHQLAERFQEGDDVIVLPLTSAPAPGSLVTLAGDGWYVLEVRTYGGAAVAHARRR